MQVCDAPAGGDGNDDERQQQGGKGNHRCQQEQWPVGKRRNPVFLEKDLDHVRYQLKSSERPDAVGTVAVLPQPQQATLDDGQHRAQEDRAQQNHQGLEHGPEDGQPFGTQPAHARTSSPGVGVEPGPAVNVTGPSAIPIGTLPAGRPTSPRGQSTWTRAGSVTQACSPVTVTSPPSSAPRAVASVSESSSTGGSIRWRMGPARAEVSSPPNRRGRTMAR